MPGRCAVALVVCAGCFFKPDPPSGTGSGSGSDSGVDEDAAGDTMMTDAGPAPWLTGYGRRRRITMNRPTTPGGTLADFPVSVVLVNDPDLAAHPTTSGSLVFADSDGTTILASEIRIYSPVNGSVEAWVRVPKLTVGLTDIFLYYSGPPRPFTPLTVYSGAYGVWHMDNAFEEVDVMEKVQVLNAPLSSYPGRGAGVVGAARTYDVDDDHLCVDQSNVLDVGASSFSVSMWVEAGFATGGQQRPFWRGGDDGSSPGFSIELGTNSWEVRLADGNAAVLAVGIGASSLSWTHLAFSVDNAANLVTTYSNGIPVESSTVPFGAIGSAQRFCIGDDTYRFAGLIDEVRVYALPHPHAWFFVEHLNLATRSMFMTIFDAEVAP